MKPDSKDFLLREFEMTWKHLQMIWRHRDQAIALYFVAFGAVAGAGLGVIPKECVRTWIAAFLGGLMCMPSYFVLPVSLFLVGVSVAVLSLMIRWHVLTAEYITVLNYVRRAFLEDSPDLRRYLVLPTTSGSAAVFRIDYALIMVVNVVSAGVIGFFTLYLLNWASADWASPRLLVRACPWIPVILWLLYWHWRYRSQSLAGDSTLAQRLSGAVAEDQRN